MEAKTAMGGRLARWMLPQTQPKHLDIDHPAIADIAAAADEIERLSQELKDTKADAREERLSGGNYWGDMAAES